MSDTKDARIHTGFPNHPKTKKLARRLGPQGPLSCLYLFLWTAANRSDGNLTGMTAEDVELAVDWPGDDGAFVAALLAVRFLDGEEGTYKIHDWAEHNPWAAGAQQRSEKARWAALCKQYGRNEAARMMPEYARRLPDAVPESASGMPEVVPEGASGTQPAPSGSAPSPNPSPSPFPSTPDTSQQAPELPEGMTAAGWASVLMRRAGCHTASASHPDLIAAVDGESVALQMLVDMVEEGKARSPPPKNLFTWAIAAARGRHADGPKPVTSNTGAHHGTRRLAPADEVEQFIRAREQGGNVIDATSAIAARYGSALEAHGSDLRPQVDQWVHGGSGGGCSEDVVEGSFRVVGKANG